jgi:hypothetical protein
MAFALIFIGVLLAVSAVRGTTSQLGALVRSDFTGQGNFIWWVAVVLAIGAIGYIRPLQALSKAFLGLIIVVLLLSKGNPIKMPQGGFFAQLFNSLKNATATAPTAATTPAATPIPNAPAANTPVLIPVSGQGQTPVSSLPSLPDLVSV